MPAIDAVLTMLPPRPCAFMRVAPCLIAEEHPAHQHREREVPLLDGRLPDRPKRPADARVVEDAVEPAEALHRERHQAGHVLLADTSTRSDARRSACPDRAASVAVSARLASFRSPTTTRAPSRRNVERAGAADPAAAAGDEGDRPVEPSAHACALRQRGFTQVSDQARRGAAALPVAAHLRPHAPGRDPPVQLELGGARREERAEHADRPVVEAGRGVEHEGLDAVVPRQGDPGVGGGDRLGGGGPGAAVAVEARGHTGSDGVGEGREEQGLDRSSGATAPPRCCRCRRATGRR